MQGRGGLKPARRRSRERAGTGLRPRWAGVWLVYLVLFEKMASQHVPGLAVFLLA